MSEKKDQNMVGTVEMKGFVEYGMPDGSVIKYPFSTKPGGVPITAEQAEQLKEEDGNGSERP